MGDLDPEKRVGHSRGFLEDPEGKMWFCVGVSLDQTTEKFGYKEMSACLA